MEAVLMRRLVRRRRQRRLNINRRLLRDSTEPLAMDNKLFVQSYRITKELFSYLCTVLSGWLITPQRCTSISVATKILTTLNFLATGSYQKPVGRDWMASISQQTASRCIHEVVMALNHLLPQFVKFPRTDRERNNIKQGFYEKFRMPGVLGCIDGTLVAILAPRTHPSEAAFFSRKGYHAINTAIICDSDFKILGICAKFGGAAHDSFVWRSWSLSQYIENKHNAGRTGWLLADSAYPLTPWLLTPILHTTENTPEAHYTNMHVRTRVCVEQCIGVLKARWRCLLRHRVLHYDPTKCARIINACAVLHNLCLNDGIAIEAIEDDPSGLSLDYDPAEFISTISSAGEHARRQLIQVLWDNRMQ